MIQSFKDTLTEAVFNGECPKGFPTTLVKVARRKLRMIDAAVRLSDLKAPPNNKLHALSKDRDGQHAIYINDQYRACFRWTNAGPTDVEITDYN